MVPSRRAVSFMNADDHFGAVLGLFHRVETEGGRERGEERRHSCGEGILPDKNGVVQFASSPNRLSFAPVARVGIERISEFVVVLVSCLCSPVPDRVHRMGISGG